MADKSKSLENKETSAESDGDKASETTETSESATSESSGDGPEIIDAEIIEPQAEESADELSDDLAQTSDILSDSQAEPSEVTSHDEQNTSHSVADDASGGTSASSFIPLVLGGILAGAAGYFAATLAPDPEPTFDTAELTAGIEENGSTIQSLSTQISELSDATAPIADTSGLENSLSEVTQTLSVIATDVKELESRLDETASLIDESVTELDERLLALETAVPAAGELATGDELAALRARIEEMTEEAEEQLSQARAEAASVSRAAEQARLAAEAEAAEALAATKSREAELAARTALQNQLIELRTSVESGAQYSEFLDGLDNVPEALMAHAETGLPTIQSLQDGFPAAARAALAQSITVSKDASTGERVAAFLRRRTSARSLTPTEGDSPDAVLSRAEAHLAKGNLELALNELEDLPRDGALALSDWRARAEARLAAAAAIDELSATN